MQRTVKIRLDDNEDLVETIRIFSKIIRTINNVAVKKKTRNKITLHHLSYKKIRKQYPDFPSGLIQTARDIVCEQLKREKKFRKFNFKEYTSIRYDKRNLRINIERNTVSISSIKGRLKFNYRDNAQSLNYKDWKVKAGTLKYFNNCLYLNMVLENETPKPNTENIKSSDFIGLDRGIKNIAVASNNQFFSSKKLKKVKGKYQYLKKILQNKGTKSAKRKLKKISGKEKRFVLDVNHCLSKKLANSDFKVFVLEELKKINNSNKGRKFNKQLGNWSFKQLETFLAYKLESLGKILIKINPKHTSQKCSRCNHIERGNRKGNVFKCKKCGYELHSDLNASRNIVELGKSEFNRLFVNQPIVASQDSYKPMTLVVGN